MLDPDDSRWYKLAGGYRTPFDPRPLVEKLEAEKYKQEIWDELWNELHHQGDVGEASYAAVPLIAEAHRKRGTPDWNPYAIVSVIDLARNRGNNPEVPGWLADEYSRAIQTLADTGMREIAKASDPESVGAILSVIALSKGLRTHASFLIEYTEDELQEIAAKNPY